MAIAVIVPDRDITEFITELSSLIDDEILTSFNQGACDKVDIAILWKHPKGTIASFPNLKLICSFGAGVEHILEDPDYRPSIPVVRIVDEELTESMSRYVVAAVSMFQYGLHFNVDDSIRDQTMRKAVYLPTLSIGILGLGALGQASAKCCQDLGYEVLGLNRTGKEVEGIRTFAMSEIDAFLSQTNILVCMLPYTDLTKDIIDYELLCKLKWPAFFINVGRGAQVVEEDLSKAVREELIMGACLDVIRDEPIAEDHPFISESRIIVTPHIASITNQRNAAKIIADNINRLKNGEELRFQVGPERGY